MSNFRQELLAAMAQEKSQFTADELYEQPLKNDNTVRARNIVHFTDERLGHHEAVISGVLDEQHVNLYVNMYGHVRIVENVPYNDTVGNNPMSWHKVNWQESNERWTACRGQHGCMMGVVTRSPWPCMPPLPPDDTPLRS